MENVKDLDIEFEQQLDGELCHVRMTVRIPPNVKKDVAYFVGKEAERAQLVFIFSATAGICDSVGQKSVGEKIRKILKMVLSRV